MSNDAGKGDARRPSGVSADQFADNWDKIFNKQYRVLEALVAENERLELYKDYDKITRNNTETQKIKQ